MAANGGKQHYLHESPVHMLLDKDNNLWVSTWGGGLYLYDRKADSFVNFLYDNANKEFLSPIVLNAIQDGDGRIWVGTQKLGLLLRTLLIGHLKKHLLEMQKNCPSCAPCLMQRTKINYG
ncbi:MAG: hypothetical protein IPG08_11475 [Sphingobacteriaceae bacterium]|nr:hypothetical protein [Sphingobacteriaceae bacterium]